MDALKAIDNRDDRKEIFYLLQKLDSAQRCRFLAACVHVSKSRSPLAADGEGVTIEITNETGTVAEVYHDLLMLIQNFDLNAVEVAADLERVVRHLQRNRKTS